LIDVFGGAGGAAGGDELGDGEGDVGGDGGAGDGEGGFEGRVVFAWEKVSWGGLEGWEKMRTIAEWVDGLGVPLVGATGAGSGVAGSVGRPECHVGHGDLVDVVAGVHGRGKTASWGDFAKDDVGKGLTTILTCSIVLDMLSIKVSGAVSYLGNHPRQESQWTSCS